MSTGLPSHHLVFQLETAADDLLGRDAVNLLSPRTHELDATTGNDEGLEIIGAEVGEQFYIGWNVISV